MVKKDKILLKVCVCFGNRNRFRHQQLNYFSFHWILCRGAAKKKKKKKHLIDDNYFNTKGANLILKIFSVRRKVKKKTALSAATARTCRADEAALHVKLLYLRVNLAHSSFEENQ